jgi:hypothetical protein
MTRDTQRRNINMRNAISIVQSPMSQNVPNSLVIMKWQDKRIIVNAGLILHS